MEKFLQNLEEADRIIKAVDHLTYVTFPLVKDKRMLLKILTETKNAVALCINSILQYDYIYKKIRLYQDTKENFRTFREKCAARYGISQQEISKITALFEIAEKHKKSPFEFVRQDKVIIMSETFRPDSITLEKTKEFVILAKNVLFKVEKGLKTNYY
jgi:hypothetical protein